MKSAKHLLPALAALFLAIAIFRPPAAKNEHPFLIIAHRGASAYAPEHTLPAYELALKMGADFLEIDLRMTKDKKLVAIHDKTVDRTTDGKGAVSSFTLAEIKRLDAGSWFNRLSPRLAREEYEQAAVPSLEDIFSYFGTAANYYIEIKTSGERTGMEEALIGLIRDYGLIGERNGKSSVIIQSFSEKSLRKICSLEPEIPLVLLLPETETQNLAARKLDHLNGCVQGIGPAYSGLRREDVARMRSAGFAVHPYTVDDPEEMRKLIQWQAGGAFTNRPDLLKAEIENRDD